MSHSQTLVLSVALIACIAVVGGCTPSSTYDKETFLLDASRPAGLESSESPAVSDEANSKLKTQNSKLAETLSVQRFSVDAAFAERNLVYRLDEFKYEPDYYREFLVTPSAMVTEETREWLANSGLFAQVLPRGSRLQAAYTLEGSVTALYGDFRDEAAPVAIMEVRYFLLRRDKAGQTIAFTQTYRSTHPVPIRTPEALIDALSRDLTDILIRFEADLRQFLSPKPGQPQRPAP
jgi:cholesterol transport system auxiliary component